MSLKTLRPNYGYFISFGHNVFKKRLLQMLLYGSAGGIGLIILFMHFTSELQGLATISRRVKVIHLIILRMGLRAPRWR